MPYPEKGAAYARDPKWLKSAMGSEGSPALETNRRWPDEMRNEMRQPQNYGDAMNERADFSPDVAPQSEKMDDGNRAGNEEIAGKVRGWLRGMLPPEE